MRQGIFKLSMTLGRSPRAQPERVKICREMGVTGCVTSPPLEGIGRDQYAAAMRQQQEEWAEAGFFYPRVRDHDAHPLPAHPPRNPGPR